MKTTLLCVAFAMLTCIVAAQEAVPTPIEPPVIPSATPAPAATPAPKATPTPEQVAQWKKEAAERRALERDALVKPTEPKDTPVPSAVTAELEELRRFKASVAVGGQMATKAQMAAMIKVPVEIELPSGVRQGYHGFVTVQIEMPANATEFERNSIVANYREELLQAGVVLENFNSLRTPQVASQAQQRERIKLGQRPQPAPGQTVFPQRDIFRFDRLSTWK